MQRWCVALAALFSLACDSGVTIPPAPEHYDVRILRDTWGVPHVFGARDRDAAYGLAWAHAEDDFHTIQISILAARGRLAAVEGRDAARFDYLARWLRVQEVARAGWERDLSAESRALAEAYAAGVNRYAALHPDQVLPGAIPVTGPDLTAGFVFQNAVFALSDDLRRLFDEDRSMDAEPELPRGSNSFAVAPLRSAGPSGLASQPTSIDNLASAAQARTWRATRATTGDNP